MASMLEGGGKTPILPPAQLQAMGFKLCAYPLSLLGVSVRAMESALAGLKTGEVPLPPAMPSFQAGHQPCSATCSRLTVLSGLVYDLLGVGTAIDCSIRAW
jgi:hypothetical protein